MKKLVCAVAALAFSAGLFSIASAMPTVHQKGLHRCPTGTMYVHGYTKNGKHVKGYCRKK